MSNYINIRENFFKKAFGKKPSSIDKPGIIAEKYFSKFLPLVEDLKNYNDIFLNLEDHCDINNMYYRFTARTKHQVIGGTLPEFTTLEMNTEQLYDFLKNKEYLDKNKFSDNQIFGKNISKSLISNECKLYIEVNIDFLDKLNIGTDKNITDYENILDELKIIYRKFRENYTDLHFTDDIFDSDNKTHITFYIS